MKLSLNWLKEFSAIPKNITPDKLGELLTVHTVEVEGVEKIGSDYIFEIDNKSITHRPDLWGTYGMAREVAAIIGGKLEKLDIRPVKVKNPLIGVRITVENKSDCPRYVAIVLDNVKIQPSPKWISDRLESAGVRSINNIVDATNYIMLEIGQPLHAFDLDKLSRPLENKLHIAVRRARPRESITTLDGNKRDLNSNNLLITDGEDPIALAGVMGGAKAEISQSTTRVVLEAATFDPVNIRKTTSQLGLRTEASSRFEKSLDPNLALTAMYRLHNLITRLIPGVISISNLIDQNNIPTRDRVLKSITVDLKEIQKKIGVDVNKNEVKKILECLGFGVKGDTIMSVTIPSWRAGRDVSIAEDIVEEVARIYGYKNIPLALPLMSSEPPLENSERKLEREVKNILTNGLGFSEVYNYSFIGEEQLAKLGVKVEGHIKVKNPISKDANLMRASLMPNLIKNIQSNLRYFEDFRLFELGRIYENKPGEDKFSTRGKTMLPKQDKILVGAWVEKANKTPFYQAKQAVETLLKKMNIWYNYKVVTALDSPYIHPARYVKIAAGERELGYITELNPVAGSNVDIGARVGLFELNFSELTKINRGAKAYRALPRYPSIKLDLSILVDKKVLWQDIQAAVKDTQTGLIKSVEAFDLYEGKGLPAEKKSLAFRVEYRSDDKTLTDEEVAEAHHQVIKKLEEIGGEVRK